MGLGYGGLKLYSHWLFPFGGSHSCDLIVNDLLRLYADAHDGTFPAGEDSPEASLSLISHEPYGASAEILRGKIVPVDAVETLLAQGKLLGPDTCGWHYVEGLRNDDNPQIAIFWDKAGLSHNGMRMSGGDRFVTRIGTGREIIRGKDWLEFLAEQRVLLEQLPPERRVMALRNFPQ